MTKDIKETKIGVKKVERPVKAVKPKFEFQPEKEEEFEQRVIDISRVARVTKGGKRLSFRACVAIGNKNGRVGAGLDKGADVTIAINKASNKARKNLINVSIVGDRTIPHEISEKYRAAKIFLKPAPKGSGIIAGGVVRIIMELVGIENISGKILGSRNKVNTVRATLNALERLSKSPSRK